MKHDGRFEGTFGSSGDYVGLVRYVEANFTFPEARREMAKA